MPPITTFLLLMSIFNSGIGDKTNLKNLELDSKSIYNTNVFTVGLGDTFRSPITSQYAGIVNLCSVQLPYGVIVEIYPTNQNSATLHPIVDLMINCAVQINSVQALHAGTWKIISRLTPLLGGQEIEREEEFTLVIGEVDKEDSSEDENLYSVVIGSSFLSPTVPQTDGIVDICTVQRPDGSVVEIYPNNDHVDSLRPTLIILQTCGVEIISVQQSDIGSWKTISVIRSMLGNPDVEREVEFVLIVKEDEYEVDPDVEIPTFTTGIGSSFQSPRTSQYDGMINVCYVRMPNGVLLEIYPTNQNAAILRPIVELSRYCELQILSVATSHVGTWSILSELRPLLGTQTIHNEQRFALVIGEVEESSEEEAQNVHTVSIGSTFQSPTTPQGHGLVVTCSVQLPDGVQLEIHPDNANSDNLKPIMPIFQTCGVEIVSVQASDAGTWKIKSVITSMIGEPDLEVEEEFVLRIQGSYLKSVTKRYAKEIELRNSEVFVVGVGDEFRGPIKTQNEGTVYKCEIVIPGNTIFEIYPSTLNNAIVKSVVEPYHYCMIEINPVLEWHLDSWKIISWLKDSNENIIEEAHENEFRLSLTEDAEQDPENNSESDKENDEDDNEFNEPKEPETYTVDIGSKFQSEIIIQNEGIIKECLVVLPDGITFQIYPTNVNTDIFKQIVEDSQLCALELLSVKSQYSGTWEIISKLTSLYYENQIIERKEQFILNVIEDDNEFNESKEPETYTVDIGSKFQSEIIIQNEGIIKECLVVLPDGITFQIYPTNVNTDIFKQIVEDSQLCALELLSVKSQYSGTWEIISKLTSLYYENQIIERKEQFILNVIEDDNEFNESKEPETYTVDIGSKFQSEIIIQNEGIIKECSVVLPDGITFPIYPTNINTNIFIPIVEESQLCALELLSVKSQHSGTWEINSKLTSLYFENQIIERKEKFILNVIGEDLEDDLTTETANTSEEEDSKDESETETENTSEGEDSKDDTETDTGNTSVDGNPPLESFVPTTETLRVVSGTPYNMLCQTSPNLAYCWFSSPNGTKYSLTEGGDSSNFRYYGAGLSFGQCGMTIQAASNSDVGYWTCNAGMDVPVDLSYKMSVNVHSTPLMARNQTVYLSTQMVLTCEMNDSSSLDYCRFVRPDGEGINVLALIQSTGQHVYNTGETNLEKGICQLIVSVPTTYQDEGRWSCYGKPKGLTEEYYDVINVVSSTGVSFSGFFYWTFMFIALLILSILITVSVFKYGSYRRFTAKRKQFDKNYIYNIEKMSPPSTI